jgi:hypothetical protein
MAFGKGAPVSETIGDGEVPEIGTRDARDPIPTTAEREESLQVARVSVVIPTLDRPARLRRAIATVRRQTLIDWELLIVDDGSSRPVALSPDEVADTRIRVIRHPNTRGVSEARNTGLKHARAPWVAFLDDDDLWRQDKLELQLSEAERHGATFLFSGRYNVDENGYTLALKGAGSSENLTRTLLLDNVVGEPSSVMARRDLFDRVGGFDPELSVIADWEMWVRLSRVSLPLGIEKLTTAIVVHEDSMQRALSHQIPLELAAMQRRHADLLTAGQTDLGSGAIDFWMTNMRWRGDPSLSSLLAYVRAARRHRQVCMIARRVIARRLHKGVPANQGIAPQWILDQLRTSPPGPSSAAVRPRISHMSASRHPPLGAPWNLPAG